MVSKTQRAELNKLRDRWKLDSIVSQRNRVAYVLRRSKENYIRVMGHERGLMQYQAECLEYAEGIGNHHEVAKFERNRVLNIIDKSFVSFHDDHVVTKLVKDFKGEIYGIFRRKPKAILDPVETDPASVKEIVLTKEQVPGPNKLIRGVGLFPHWSREVSAWSKKYAVVAAASTLLVAGSSANASAASLCRVTYVESDETTQSVTASLTQAYDDLEPGSDFYFPEMVYPVGNIEVSSYFGYRNSPCVGCSTNHRGVDFAPGYGTDVRAAIAGTVTSVGYEGELGYTISIKDGKGMETIYAHLIPDSGKVSPGDVVSLGQTIAKVGNSGLSTGSHLHFEIKLFGRHVDPLGILKAFVR